MRSMPSGARSRRSTGFRPELLDAVVAGLTGLSGRIDAGLPASNDATVATRLPDILAAVDRSVLVTQSGILLLLIQFAVLGGYAVILVAALLMERRRTETALLRARGAGSRHLATMALGEAILITIPAAILAPWLATAMVAAVSLDPTLAGVGLTAPLPGSTTFLVVVVGAAAAVVVLTLPTLASNVSIAGVRAGIGRQIGRTLPQRLGLDFALVALAAIALFQLRLYGAPLTRNGRGVLGVDPLLVAAPSIGLIAGAVLAVRIVPRLAEVAERGLVRYRGLVPAMGGRQLARRPLRYTRAALLLILAAALGTFASTYAATWARSQEDQAAFASGADVRVEPGTRTRVPGWAYGAALRDLPGVTAATPVVRETATLGSTLRDGAVLAVDPEAMARVVRLREGDARDRTLAALGTLADRRPATPGIPLPDGTRRISLVVDLELRPVEGFAPVPDGFEGLTAAVMVADGDGRLCARGLSTGGTGAGRRAPGDTARG